MEPSVSLVFPAYNRLEFTKQSWAALMANTDWSLVTEFHVYDDGSTDGTSEFLAAEVTKRRSIMPWLPGRLLEMHHTIFRSPMGLTLDWIRRSGAPLLAKLDNDTIYPPGWLNVAVNVMNAVPRLAMLGLECMRQPAAFEVFDGVPIYTKKAQGDFTLTQKQILSFSFLPARFISGLGLYRKAAFERGLPQDGGYYGLEEWQEANPGVQSGWILPSLPVFLLDRLPIEPWASLSKEYVRQGWQRPWSLDLRYKPEQEPMWNWWRPVA